MIPTLIEEGTALLERLYLGSRPVPPATRDGNLHFNLCAPAEAVGDLERGRISSLPGRNQRRLPRSGRGDGRLDLAEHGIGQLKKDELARTADPVGLHSCAAQGHARP